MSETRNPKDETMRLNQVTATALDFDAARNFYCTLGLAPIVDARPRYARFYCADGERTFSLDQGDQVGRGTIVYFECDDLDETVHGLKAAGLQFASEAEDKSWLWREAEIFDPSGNRVIVYRAGDNRLNPPWRLSAAPTSKEPTETAKIAAAQLLLCQGTCLRSRDGHVLGPKPIE